MAQPAVALADLLAAAATSLATANVRLAGAGQGALIRELNLQLQFSSRVVADGAGLTLTRIAAPNLQQMALAGGRQPVANTSLSVQVIAAPQTRGSIQAEGGEAGAIQADGS